MRYRICRNAEPHQSDWWTVEYEANPRLLGRIFRMKPKWLTVHEWDLIFSPYGPNTHPRRFDDENEAQAWIDEAKRERVHECGQPQ